MSSLEKKVDQVRASLNSRLLDNSHTKNPLSDEAIAAIVAAEARQSAELATRLGPRAYLMRHDPNGSSHEARKLPDTNKTFLQNTIRSVESHNRREQIDSAWRQHGLLKKLDRGEVFTSSGDRNHLRNHHQNQRDEGSRSPSTRHTENRKRVRSEDHDRHPVDGDSNSDGSASGDEDERGEDKRHTPHNYHKNGRRGSETDSSSSANQSNSANNNSSDTGSDDEDPRRNANDDRAVSFGRVAQLDAATQREIWAARKIRAFTTPIVRAAHTQESSSTELGEIKEHKLPRERDEKAHKAKKSRKHKKKESKGKEHKEHKKHKKHKSDKHKS